MWMIQDFFSSLASDLKFIRYVIVLKYLEREIVVHISSEGFKKKIFPPEDIIYVT